MSDDSNAPADLSNLGIDLSQIFRPSWTVESSDSTARLAAKYDDGIGANAPSVRVAIAIGKVNIVAQEGMGSLINETRESRAPKGAVLELDAMPRAGSEVSVALATAALVVIVMLRIADGRSGALSHHRRPCWKGGRFHWFQSIRPSTQSPSKSAHEPRLIPSSSLHDSS